MQADATFDQLLARVRLLFPQEKARLVESLMADLVQQIENQQSHSIMELKGLGKELWQGIDVEKYREEERSSWRG